MNPQLYKNVFCACGKPAFAKNLCEPCYGAAWRAANPGHKEAYLKANHLKILGQERLRRSGITAEQYSDKLAEQNAVCGLCKFPFTDQHKEKPVADHDHVTGEFRGVLHRNCNLGIGNFNDDVNLLDKAKSYLLKF